MALARNLARLGAQVIAVDRNMQFVATVYLQVIPNQPTQWNGKRVPTSVSVIRTEVTQQQPECQVQPILHQQGFREPVHRIRFVRY